MSKHEVKITGFEFNMAGWTTEKACSVVEFAARALDELRQMSPVPLGSAAKMRSYLGWMVWNSTKLWSAGCGADWEPDHSDMVVKGGMRGFKKLYRRYHGHEFMPTSTTKGAG